MIWLNIPHILFSAVNPCQVNPCANNGRCLVEVGGCNAVCQCDSNTCFTGPRCEIRKLTIFSFKKSIRTNVVWISSYSSFLYQTTLHGTKIYVLICDTTSLQFYPVYGRKPNNLRFSYLRRLLVESIECNKDLANVLSFHFQFISSESQIVSIVRVWFLLPLIYPLFILVAAIDPCAGNPCENGGVCQRDFAQGCFAYTCVCSECWQGEDCTERKSWTNLINGLISNVYCCIYDICYWLPWRNFVAFHNFF